MDNLILNGRKPLVIVQEQSLYPWQADGYADLNGNGIQGLGQIGLFQSVDHPHRVIADFGAQHFHAHGGGDAEPHEAVVAHSKLSRQVVESHAVAFGLDIEVGGQPFEGLRRCRRNGFLARGARGGSQQQNQKCYGGPVFHIYPFLQILFQTRVMDYFGAKLRKRYEFAIETKRASTLRNDRGSLHSFFAFPAIGPSVQGLPALHPFVVGSHRVFFGDVHCGLRLFNGWHFVLSVIPLLASRQQQGGRGGHCC